MTKTWLAGRIPVRDKLNELERTNNSQENARRFLTLKLDYQNKILKYIKERLGKSKNVPIETNDLVKESGFSETDIQLALDYLENDWIVSYDEEKKGYVLI